MPSSLLSSSSLNLSHYNKLYTIYQELTVQYYYYTLGLNLSITVHIDFTAINLWLNQQFAFNNYCSLCPIFWSGFCENGKACISMYSSIVHDYYGPCICRLHFTRHKNQSLCNSGKSVHAVR